MVPSGILSPGFGSVLCCVMTAFPFQFVSQTTTHRMRRTDEELNRAKFSWVPSWKSIAQVAEKPLREDDQLPRRAYNIRFVKSTDRCAVVEQDVQFSLGWQPPISVAV